MKREFQIILVHTNHSLRFCSCGWNGKFRHVQNNRISPLTVRLLGLKLCCVPWEEAVFLKFRDRHMQCRLNYEYSP